MLELVQQFDSQDAGRGEAEGGDLHYSLPLVYLRFGVYSAVGHEKQEDQYRENAGESEGRRGRGRETYNPHHRIPVPPTGRAIGNQQQQIIEQLVRDRNQLLCAGTRPLD